MCCVKTFTEIILTQCINPYIYGHISQMKLLNKNLDLSMRAYGFILHKKYQRNIKVKENIWTSMDGLLYYVKQLVSTSTSEDGRAGEESKLHLPKKITQTLFYKSRQVSRLDSSSYCMVSGKWSISV